MEEQSSSTTEQKEEVNQNSHVNSAMPKRLYRIRDGRIIFGVATGLAEYFDVDVFLIRLAFIALGLVSGSGVVLYILLGLIIPEKPGEQSVDNREKSAREFANQVHQGAQKLAEEIKSTHAAHTSSAHKRGGEARNFLAIVFILAGGLMILNQFTPLHFWRNAFFWPSILIFIGLVILFNKRD